MARPLSFVILVFLTFTMSGQDLLIHNIKNKVPTVSKDAILNQFTSSLNTDFGSIYVDLTLEEIGERKKASKKKKKKKDDKVILTSELTIRVYSLLDESKLSYKTFELTGSGRSLKSARKSIVRSISKSEKEINAFLSDAATRAQPKECDTLKSIINKYIDTHKFKKAIALASTPVDECADGLWVLKQKAYYIYQQKYCGRHLERARSFVDLKDYSRAIRELQNTNPTSACYEGINTIINEIQAHYKTSSDQSFKAYLAFVDQPSFDEKDQKKIINMFSVNHMLDVD